MTGKQCGERPQPFRRRRGEHVPGHVVENLRKHQEQRPGIIIHRVEFAVEQHHHDEQTMDTAKTAVVDQEEQATEQAP